MQTFKYYIIESEEKIEHHLKKFPDHVGFLNNFLSSNRHTRSKYLDWVTNSLKRTDASKFKGNVNHASKLGEAIDYYHSAKSKKGFLGHKDINKYASHNDFIEHMGKISNDSPISDKETTYSHPDNKVIHNDKGLKITKIGSFDAMTHTRDHFKNSWCVAQKTNPSLYYDTYKHLHLHEYRDSKGKINRFLSAMYRGKTSEIRNENDDHVDYSKIPEHMRSILYNKGAPGVKGSIKFAPKELVQKHIDAINKDSSWDEISQAITDFPQSHGRISSFLNNKEFKQKFLKNDEDGEYINSLATSSDAHKHIVNNISAEDNNDISELHNLMLRTSDNKTELAKHMLDKFNIFTSDNALTHLVKNGHVDDVLKTFHTNSDPTYPDYFPENVADAMAENPDHYDKLVDFYKQNKNSALPNAISDISKDPTYPPKKLLDLGVDRLPHEAIGNIIKFNKHLEPSIIDNLHNEVLKSENGTRSDFIYRNMTRMAYDPKYHDLLHKIYKNEPFHEPVLRGYLEKATDSDKVIEQLQKHNENDTRHYALDVIGMYNRNPEVLNDVAKHYNYNFKNCYALNSFWDNPGKDQKTIRDHIGDSFLDKASSENFTDYDWRNNVHMLKKIIDHGNINHLRALSTTKIPNMAGYGNFNSQINKKLKEAEGSTNPITHNPEQKLPQEAEVKNEPQQPVKLLKPVSLKDRIRNLFGKKHFTR